MIPVFDGHNDVLSRLWRHGDRDGETFFAEQAKGHIDMPRARRGGFAGGFFAIYVPSRGGGRRIAGQGEEFDAIDAGWALETARAQAAIFDNLVERSGGEFVRVRTVDDIRRARQTGKVAGILHLEGADPISADLSELDEFVLLGLKSLGLVWSRPTIFAHGVPFRFPHSPDTGPGLTPAGEDLVRRCNELRVMVDLSHLNEKGFWDVARTSTAPLVATHSNVHALCPSSRNLTDAQLEAISASKGVVGLNLAVAFLRTDGKEADATALDIAVRHLAYMVDKLGEDGVAIGSDFDGAMIPRQIGDVSGLPVLVEAMRAAGFGEPLVEKICHRNWESLLERTWGR